MTKDNLAEALAAISSATKTKAVVWVLTSTIPEETAPCFPQVFGDAAVARAEFERIMREEWDANGPEDDDGNRLPYPEEGAEEACRIIASNDPDEAWGEWELSRHEIEIVHT